MLGWMDDGQLGWWWLSCEDGRSFSPRAFSVPMVFSQHCFLRPLALANIQKIPKWGKASLELRASWKQQPCLVLGAIPSPTSTPIERKWWYIVLRYT